MGCVGVSPAGGAPSEWLWAEVGVFSRGIACEGLIYASGLYCASCALVHVLLQD